MTDHSLFQSVAPPLSGVTGPNMITFAAAADQYHRSQCPPLYTNTHIVQASPIYPVCSLKIPEYGMYEAPPPVAGAGAAHGTFGAMARQRPDVDVQEMAPQILHYYPHPVPGSYHHPPHQMTRRSADVSVVQSPHHSPMVSSVAFILHYLKEKLSSVYHILRGLGDLPPVVCPGELPLAEAKPHFGNGG